MIVNIKHLHGAEADAKIARLANRNAAARAYEQCFGAPEQAIHVERSIDEETRQRSRPTPGSVAYRKCRRPWWFGGLAAMYLAGYAVALWLVPWGLATVIGVSLVYLVWAARVAPVAKVVRR